MIIFFFYKDKLKKSKMLNLKINLAKMVQLLKAVQVTIEENK